MKELGFTDSQAYQRIQAMRALREIPELKTKIESGTLSVTSISKAQVYFKKEKQLGKKTGTKEKLTFFESLENKTSHEVDARIAEVRGETFKRKIVLELDDELERLWNQVNHSCAHRTKGCKEIFLKMLLESWVKNNSPTPDQCAVPSTTWVGKNASSNKSLPSEAKKASSPSTRYIPAKLQLEIKNRDLHRCTNCGSQHALEIDHIHPFAFGGRTESENLRLLCRSCNQFQARQVFDYSKSFVLK